MSDERNGQDETMNCGLGVDARARLHDGLRQLPETMPPRSVWQRIEAQARAEGLLARRSPVARYGWSTGAGMAAAVVLAVLVVPATFERGELETFPTEPEYVESVNPAGLNALTALMVESQQLEQDLRSLPVEPQVVRAGTAATIAAVEDQIAAIDYRLNHTPTRMSPEQIELYWRERVRLMKLLVQLRSAQAQRNSF